MVTLKLSTEDHARVSAAIAAAEEKSDGEIIAICADQSDAYHDVGLHWAVLAMVAVLAFFAAMPQQLIAWYDRLHGWSVEPGLRELLTLLLFFALLKFLAVLFILKWRPLRMLLTPGSTKTRRVRRRAIMLFRTGAERRTIGRTGILIYLSMAEHRAEIVGDEAITKVTTPETWGEAMTALLAEVKAGRPGNGIVAAVEQIGEVLAVHFPKTGEDTNEIPDKLIEL
ncbi:MAG TPA: TPM domain-containing protein [Sphingomicrobium sp.]|nr:TPM domain-containing protein [Sphingomicrobium sp.]